MIACVTGAAGFIGRQLCSALISAGYEVRALGRRAVSSFPESINYFRGDIALGVGDFAAFFSDADVVFHCAGELSKPEQMFSLHIDGTVFLLGCVQCEVEASGKPLHWVQLSSVGAYGISAEEASAPRVVESATTESPDNSYEITKTASDHLVVAFAKQHPYFSYSIVRPSIVVGATMPNQSFFQLANMVRRGLFFYVGRHDSVANYVHIDDVVAALLLCGFSEGAKGGTFIVANDCSLREVIDAMADLYGVRRPRLRVPEGFMRAVAAVGTTIRSFPLTQSRVDALVRRTSYISNFNSSGLELSYKNPIPEKIASILEGRFDGAHLRGKG